MLVRLAVLVVSALAIPLRAGAQLTVLEVRVRDAARAEPLARVEVRVEGLGVGGVTNERGELHLRAVPAGERAVEASLLGYAPARTSVVVPSEGRAEVAIELEPSPVALDPVDVVASGGVLEQHGFFERREGGQGTFFTRAEIDRLRPRFLSDMLRRVPGMSLTPTRTGARASLRGARPSCGIQYYLNGVLAPYFDVDQILPNDVEGLEIYRGAATIPPAFNRGTALCGVVLIWTRAR